MERRRGKKKRARLSTTTSPRARPLRDDDDDKDPGVLETTWGRPQETPTPRRDDGIRGPALREQVPVHHGEIARANEQDLPTAKASVYLFVSSKVARLGRGGVQLVRFEREQLVLFHGHDFAGQLGREPRVVDLSPSQVAVFEQ